MELVKIIRKGKRMRPLVTFCQMCFNQKEYIGAAIDAAFSQTYTPLEIVINDDHSTDGSWEIIQQKTAAYVGPHKLIIHRNETNLGIAKNCQVMFSIAHGELFVKGDGDDISLPDRVEKLVAAWELHDRRADILVSGYVKMDMDGKAYDSVNPPFTGWDLRPFGDWFRCAGFFYLGAAFAVSRRLYDLFPKEVRFGRAGDDNIYTGRAALLNGVGAGGGGYVIPDILVRHRMGSGVSNSRGRSYRQKMLDVYCLVHEALLQNEEDLRYCSFTLDGVGGGGNGLHFE